ncbi:hypothetical protein NLJ89_g9316 [Agrocybe chaxingu]|uniref:Uncharacterized protein n=1 Tax=Agrocybe chaxingu TaxID=84603 RepID=A0A9W8JW14_9AGAR|nr:hypothetical protein NLJ89_g9316 [Agrocybe chaxingu]
MHNMPPRSAPKPKKGKKALKKKIIETRSTGKEPAAKATTVKTVQTDIKYVTYCVKLSTLPDGSRRWNDEPQLSLGLVAAITDNPDIKQGLFPSPGGNVSTAKGGGTKKITWQWQLAEIIFKDHKKYGAELRKALDDSGLQKAWAEKIKNRLKTYEPQFSLLFHKAISDTLSRMTQTTQKHIEALGKTGAGISRVEEIDLSKDNRFMTQWKLTAVQCPYFFEMRELIGEHPNLIRTGIGNSTSDIDLDILQDPSEAAADAVDAADPGDDDADVSEGPVDLTDGDRSTSEGVLYDSLSKELDTTDDDEADLVPPPSTKDDKPKATLKRKAASSDVPSSSYSGHSSPMTFADPADFPNNFHTGYGDVHQQMTYPQVNITANSGDDMGDDMYVEEGI